jgi:fructokinase
MGRMGPMGRISRAFSAREDSVHQGDGSSAPADLDWRGPGRGLRIPVVEKLLDMMNYKVFGIGEVLWDLLPAGRQMGGAPANFACHARVLGADGCLISRVGNDALGREILERLGKLGVSTQAVAIDPEHATGTVTVELTAGGQPCYTIHEGVGWDHLQPDGSLLSRIADADALCFGTLAQRCEPSRSTILQLVANAPERAVRIFDVNLRQDFYSREILDASARLANVVKLNDAELPVVSRLLGIPGARKEQMAALLEKYELHLLACTCGSEGSILFDGEAWCEAPPPPVNVVDTVGAGDAFTAAMTLGMLAGWSIEKLAEVANEVAAYVCSCAGGTPEMPDRFRAYWM